MAPGNVEVVRSLFDAQWRGDERAMLEPISPEIVVTQFPDQLDARAFEGHDGVRQAMRDWIGTWDDWTIELIRATEIDGHVLAIAVQRGRGKASGAPIEGEVAFVFSFRDGLIVRWQMFRTEPEALAALSGGEAA